MNNLTIDQLQDINGGFKIGSFLAGAVGVGAGIAGICLGNPVGGAVGIYYGAINICGSF